jgi:hypothetical protein
MLRSASYLGLCLVCTRGTPVADMLAHSPPLPLIIDHINQDPVTTAEDEEGILLALQHHDRVRRVRLEPRHALASDDPPICNFNGFRLCLG